MPQNNVEAALKWQRVGRASQSCLSYLMMFLCASPAPVPVPILLQAVEGYSLSKGLNTSQQLYQVFQPALSAAVAAAFAVAPPLW